MGSTWGRILKISVFGESHGAGVGIVIDGFPAGIAVDEEFIRLEMARRAPGGRLATPRKESDECEIVSGVYKGTTTGAPVCGMIRNTNTRSADYLDLADVPRPSHADLTSRQRYKGYSDLRGGGHFSGRLTAPLVFAGALCKLYLKGYGVMIGAHLKSVGAISDDSFENRHMDREFFDRLAGRELPFISEEAGARAMAEILARKADGDSVGGVVECAVAGMRAGLGSPMFDAVESRIADIVFAVPGVKGVEFGEGFNIARMFGSQANDKYCVKDDKICPETNNSGGCLGGITTGAPIIFRAAFKPTASIAKPQLTANIKTGTMEELSVPGRHDPCIAVRAVPVIEAVSAIAATDIMLEAFGYERT